MKRYLSKILSTAILLQAVLTGCGKKTTISVTKPEEQATEASAIMASMEDMDFSFPEEETVEENGMAIDLSQSVGGVYRITAGGTYLVTGAVRDTMLIVDADGKNVTILLNGVTIQNTAGPCIYVRAADQVTLTLAEGSENFLADGSSYEIADGGSNLDAALFSQGDLIINGTGSLTVEGNYKHGIVSKDDLVVTAGTVNITACKVGLNGKDCVKLGGGNITITAGSDGIRSDNDEDPSRGYIYLYGGSVDISAGNDGIQAETVVKAEQTDLTVTAGGGSSQSVSSSEESYKGIKAGTDLSVTGGSFRIDSRDDCIHANGSIAISGGVYQLSSGDDGIHADAQIQISGDKTRLSILKSYEGIEATSVLISGGEISVAASDDGINAAGGKDTAAARPGRNGFAASTGEIIISGGTIDVQANGDGLDANGALTISGGCIKVSCPVSGDTSILDYDTAGTITGGIFVGMGAASMAQTFGTASTQGVISMRTEPQSAGTAVSLLDSGGNSLIDETAGQSFQYVILSCPSLVVGGSYTLNIGASSHSLTLSSLLYGESGGMPGGRMDHSFENPGISGSKENEPGRGMEERSGMPSGRKP